VALLWPKYGQEPIAYCSLGEAREWAEAKVAEIMAREQVTRKRLIKEFRANGCTNMLKLLGEPIEVDPA